MILETQEDKQIKHPQMLTPNSFNVKPNHPKTLLCNQMYRWVAT